MLSASSGIAWGALGVLAFSFTVPFTRIAVEALSPVFVGSARAVVAAALAATALAVTRQPLPKGREWVRLAVVAGGVVVGFPLLTSVALTTADASHSAVVIGLLPAATAVVAVLRGKERPTGSFWLFSGVGVIVALVFAISQSDGIAPLRWADLLLFGAVIAAAVGYAEGGLLARRLGAWQTVSWALVLAAPVMILMTAVSAAQEAPVATPIQWAAFGYLAVVSMFLGFFAWYRGLAIGPMSQVSQVQLIQPVLTILWAVLFLGEPVTMPTAIAGLAVIVCTALAVRTRLAGTGAAR